MTGNVNMTSTKTSSSRLGRKVNGESNVKRQRVDDDVETETTTVGKLSSALDARLAWLAATQPAAMEAVIQFYRDEMSRLKAARVHTNSTMSEAEVEVREKLILLLIQSGRPEAAVAGLESLGYVARLASCVLDYPTSFSAEDVARTHATVKPPCLAVDGALSADTLRRLRGALQSPTAPFWTAHQYSVEPPSPYFSYVIPLSVLERKEGFGALGSVIHSVLAMGERRFGKEAMDGIRFAELWAHNRPHASGHQLHYDSDDEGRGGLRHPTVTSVTFVDGDVGGPTLMTNQRLGDPHLGTLGWLCPSKSNRILVFDGNYLHGVIPGKGCSPLPSGRRVTMMVALWCHIQVRDEPGPGSARPFPLGPDQPEWAKQLTSGPSSLHTTTVDADAIALPLLWERVNCHPWPSKAPIPPYDAVYQGF